MIIYANRSKRMLPFILLIILSAFISTTFPEMVYINGISGVILVIFSFVKLIWKLEIGDTSLTLYRKNIWGQEKMSTFKNEEIEITINAPVRTSVTELFCTIKDLAKKRSIGSVSLKLNAKENSLEALLMQLEKGGVKVRGIQRKST